MNLLFITLAVILLFILIAITIYLLTVPNRRIKEKFSDFSCSLIYNIQQKVFETIQNLVKNGGPVTAVSIFDSIAPVDLVMTLPAIKPIQVDEKTTITPKFNSDKISIQNSISTWDNLFLSTNINKNDPFTISLDPFTLQKITFKNLTLTNLYIQQINQFTFLLKDFKDCIITTDFIGNNNFNIHLRQSFNIPFKLLCDATVDISGLFSNHGIQDKIDATGDYNFDGDVVITVNYNQPDDVITIKNLEATNNHDNPLEINIDQNISLKGMSTILPKSIQDKLKNMIEKQLPSAIQNFIDDKPFYYVLLKDVDFSISKINENMKICDKINDSLTSIFDIIQNKLILPHNKVVQSYKFENIPNMGNMTFDLKPFKTNLLGSDVYLINSKTRFDLFSLTSHTDFKKFNDKLNTIKISIPSTDFKVKGTCSGTASGPLRIHSFELGIRPQKKKIVNISFDRLKCSPFLINNDEKYFVFNMNVLLNIELPSLITLRSNAEMNLVVRTWLGIVVQKGLIDIILQYYLELEPISIELNFDAVLDIINNKIKIIPKKIDLKKEMKIKNFKSVLHISSKNSISNMIMQITSAIWKGKLQKQIDDTMKKTVNDMFKNVPTFINNLLSSKPTFDFNLPPKI